MSDNAPIVEEAYIILQQLGGKDFLLMTGSYNLFAAGRTEHNPNAWLRLNLQANGSGANRLRITLMPSDTYQVEFYHQQLINWETVITKEQIFAEVYGEDLPSLFREVTGFETRLPVIIRASR